MSDGISKWNDPEFIRRYQEEYRKKHKRKARNYHRQYCQIHQDGLKRYHHKYHKENTARIHKQKRGYYQQNKIRIRRKNVKNRDCRSAYNKAYYRANKPRIISAACVRTKNRYHTDTLFKVKMLLRGRLYAVCKCKKLIKPKTMVLLGCDLKTFKTYMETLFVSGMTWNNHRKWGWHIDHIMPLEMAKSSKDMELLCHYKNLQPLWWYDNLSKSGRVPLTTKKV
jgi:hypothetical protein